MVSWGVGEPKIPPVISFEGFPWDRSILLVLFLCTKRSSDRNHNSFMVLSFAKRMCLKKAFCVSRLDLHNKYVCLSMPSEVELNRAELHEVCWHESSAAFIPIIQTQFCGIGAKSKITKLWNMAWNCSHRVILDHFVLKHSVSFHQSWIWYILKTTTEKLAPLFWFLQIINFIYAISQLVIQHASQKKFLVRH